ncbi:MAG: hypothetical protein ACREM3_31360, partial [Candidatus Rokuibacteriota bacterium]
PTPSPERERPAPVVVQVTRAMGAAAPPPAVEGNRIARVLEPGAAREADGPSPAVPAPGGVRPSPRAVSETAIAGERAPSPAPAPMGAPEALRAPAREVRVVLPPTPELVPAPRRERPPGKQVRIGTLHVTVKAPAAAPPSAPVAAPVPASSGPAPSHRDPWDAAFVSFH